MSASRHATGGGWKSSTDTITGLKLSRRDLLKGALATAGLAVAGCAGGGEEETPLAPTAVAEGEPKRGGTIRLASLAPVLSLDPHTTQGVSVAPNFYGYVVHATDWQGTVGDLAESWETIDELDWVFKLRDGVRFQDVPPVGGRPVVAEDIVYSIDRLKALPVSSAVWEQWTERYEAPDPRTFTLRTPRPYGYMLMTLGSPLTAIVPREAVEEFGDLSAQVVGSGPFMLKSYGRDSGLEMARNPGYYRPELPYVDGISVKVMPDDASIQVAFRAGSIDVYGADNKLKADAVADVKGVVVGSYLARPYSVFELNGAKVEAFRDRRVRWAIDLALDRQAMIDKLHFGGGELAGPVGPLWDSSLPAAEVASAYVRDVAKARQLLSAAGAEGLRFPLRFASFANNPDRAAIIQQNLADAGITAEMQPGELGAWLAAYLDGNFESTTFQHLSYLSDDIQLQSHHTYGWGRTEAGYRGIEDAEVDRLLEEVQQTPDEEKRIEVAREAQRLVLERHGPVLVLYQPYGYWCAYDYIKGYDATAYGFGLYKYDYWLDKG